jgi:glycosyltransferase involved in cell wall biosynthesis
MRLDPSQEITGTRKPRPVLDTHPPVSIIVPVSRLGQAAKTLETLINQRYAGKMEIIVVGARADELTRLWPDWPIIPINCGAVREPGRARNIGAERASGDILLFLDDDCIVAEDWTEKNVHMLSQQKVGAVGACIRGTSHAFFARCVDFTNFGYYQRKRLIDTPVASASMGVHRTVFHRAGGFDEHMRSGEDMDLCCRIQQLGYRTVYQPAIVVLHDHGRDTLGKLLHYNYHHGMRGGLLPKIKNREVGLRNRLLSRLRFPVLYLVLVPFLALIATARIVQLNCCTTPSVLLYSPFIFLGKLCYQLGVLCNLIRRYNWL